MLTFALCVIAFFIGFCCAVYSMYATFRKIFQTIDNAVSRLFDSFKSEISEPNREVIIDELEKIDLSSIAETFSFALNFAIEKMDEFKQKAKEREAEKAEQESEQEDTRTDAELWEEHRKKYWESSKNPVGTPQEPLKNPVGTPQELRKEPLDNQGVPKNDDFIEQLIEESKLAESSVWKTNL